MATKRKADAAPKPETEPFSERTVTCPGYPGLNVREKPSPTAKVISTVPCGHKVMAAEPKRGWCEVESGGFAKAEYLV